MKLKIYVLFSAVLLARTWKCNAVDLANMTEYLYIADAKAWFRLNAQPKNWATAKQLCTMEGAKLASPDTPGMSAVLTEFNLGYREIDRHYFSFDHNQPMLKLHSWLVGEPQIQDYKEMCSLYAMDRVKVEGDCNNPYPYICYKNNLDDHVTTESVTTETNMKMFRSDYEYISEGGGWFKLHELPVDWQEARLRCAYEGAVLASPTTIGLNAVMKTLAVRIRGIVYTGIHATVSNGDFNSVDGTHVADIALSWLNGNPNNDGSNENCIVMHQGGLAEDVDCSKPYSFVCYKKYSEDLLVTECGTTDRKYKLDEKTRMCYKFHPMVTTNSNAAAVCSAEGGQLAIINSNEEAEVLKSIVGQSSTSKSPPYSDRIWLGFYNWKGSNFFGTLHGQSLEDAGYEKWTTGKPSFYVDGIPQRCGGMLLDGLLVDINCDINLSFICEKDPETLRKSKKKYAPLPKFRYL